MIYFRSQKATLALLSVALFFIVSSNVLLSKSETSSTKILIPPPSGLQYFHFGYRNLLADFLWIRSIQDIDYCDSKLSSGVCIGQGWLYKMFDTATDLSPSLRSPLAFGPIVLDLLVKDKEGSTQLYNKAVRLYPNDWVILYRAAYNALEVEKNKSKAAELLVRAGKNGAPQWVFALSARLMKEEGAQDSAIQMLEQMIAENPEGPFTSRLKERLRELRGY